jgi:hypothetical protein
MKGNCTHEAGWCWTDRAHASPKGVCLNNTDDSHYHTIFETPEEVDAFIAELEAAKLEAFGHTETKK